MMDHVLQQLGKKLFNLTQKTKPVQTLSQNGNITDLNSFRVNPVLIPLNRRGSLHSTHKGLPRQAVELQKQSTIPQTLTTVGSHFIIHSVSSLFDKVLDDKPNDSTESGKRYLLLHGAFRKYNTKQTNNDYMVQQISLCQYIYYTLTLNS